MKLPRVTATRYMITIDHATPAASEGAIRDAVLAFAQNAGAEDWDNLRFWARAMSSAEDERLESDYLASFTAILHDILPRADDWPDTRIYVAPDEVPALRDLLAADVEGAVTDIKAVS